MATDVPIHEQDLVEGLVAASESLAQHHVNYAVIGGMAAGYRSQPRFTKDFDLLLNVTQLGLPPLLETFERRGFDFDLMATIREWTQHHMVTLKYRGIPVDWLKPVVPAYQHVLDCATDETWLGHSIRVASAEGLILLKLLAFRAQDLADIENLVAARRSALDVNWIRNEWQTLAALDDPRMARFLAFAAGDKQSMVP